MVQQPGSRLSGRHERTAWHAGGDILSSRWQALRLRFLSVSNWISATDPFCPTSTGPPSPKAAMVVAMAGATVTVAETGMAGGTEMGVARATGTREAGTVVARLAGAQ